MKKLQLLDDLHAGRLEGRDLGDINHTAFWAYVYSQEADNETLNFNEVIWDHDVEDIIKFCHAFAIKEITISSNFSGLIPTLALFEKIGCKLEGLTEVNDRFKDYITGEFKKLPALKIKIA